MTKRALQVAIAGVTFVAPVLAGNGAVPEPGTILLIGGGLGALILFGRRKHARK